MQLLYGFGTSKELDRERAGRPTMGPREPDDNIVSARVEGGGFGLSEETGRIVLATLRLRCRALPIPPEDREDIVQDVAIWIARHRIASRPVTKAWLWSTLSRFASNFRPVQKREMALDDLPEGTEPTRAPRRPSASIEELTRGLGKKERRVVALRLEGHTWESALRQVGICHGTHSRWRSRIRRTIGKALGTLRKG